MISGIKAFFEQQFGEEKQDDGDLDGERLNLSCAALMIEVATIDRSFEKPEFDALLKILTSQYGLTREQCDDLVTLAQEEIRESTSLYQFTQLIHDRCSYPQKLNLVKGMWTIAFADGDLDKYEEYIIRKTSELMHVAHADFIRTKQEARAEAHP